MPNEDLSKDTRQIYAAFSHPIRKTIVDLMAKNERIGFRDLKEELNVSVGTLYYHLDTLGDLVTQDKKRKYILQKVRRRSGGNRERFFICINKK